MRLVWMLDAGLPRPLVNRPIFDLDGRLLGYPDNLDEEAGCVLEYDSDDHRDLEHHTADNDREEPFEDHGLVVCRVTRLNLRQPRHTLAQRMQLARARGLTGTDAATGGRSDRRRAGPTHGIGHRGSATYGAGETQPRPVRSVRDAAAPSGPKNCSHVPNQPATRTPVPNPALTSSCDPNGREVTRRSG